MKREDDAKMSGIDDQCGRGEVGVRSWQSPTWGGGGSIDLPKPRPNIRKEGGGQGGKCGPSSAGWIAVSHLCNVHTTLRRSIDGWSSRSSFGPDGYGGRRRRRRRSSSADGRYVRKRSTTVADAPAIPLRSALGLHLPFMLSLPWHRIKRGRCDALKCRARMHVHTHCTIRLRSTNATHRG